MINNVVELLGQNLHFSSDPDHQTHCFIEAIDGQHIIEGFNRLPGRVSIRQERVVRPRKYDWIIHAEADAISKAARLGITLSKATVYMRWFPCQECAKLIANSGIKTVYCDPDWEEIPRYQFQIAKTILEESGVEIKDITEL